MHDIGTVTQLLKQLLAVQPELGARLKQRLIAAFVRDGLGRFDERTLGYKRFKDYLKNEHGDVVLIEPLPGQDISVSLRQAHQVTPILGKKNLAIRREVWMAFSNPDLNRKRFFDKESGAVIHFLVNQTTTARTEVEKTPDRYIEIRPILGELQDQWMRTFLTEAPLDQVTKDALSPLLQAPYSTATNAAFTRALGSYGQGWRKYRTDKVVTCIETWSKETNVSMDLLVVPVKHSTTATKEEVMAPARNSPAKEKAIKIIDLLSEDDIRDVVIPVLVSTLLIEQRR